MSTVNFQGHYSLYGTEEIFTLRYYTHRATCYYSTALTVEDVETNKETGDLVATLGKIDCYTRSKNPSGENYAYFYLVDPDAQWEAYVSQTPSAMTISIAGEDIETIDLVVEKFSTLFTPLKVEEDLISIKLWHKADKPRYDIKKMPASKWENAAGNYSTTAQEQFSHLLNLRPPFDGGKMILFYGPPGMGKTNIIRTLAREWKEWANIDYVMDPDVFFEHTPYLLELVTGATNSKKWSIIVAEDSDEFIRADAKQRSGQGLSRLLNVTDGLAGQGTNLLVLLTTNEPLSSLHPAVTRPGRCIAKIEFPKLNRTEAKDWAYKNELALPSDTQEFSLAELYNMKQEQRQISLETEAPVYGTYL